MANIIYPKWKEARLQSTANAALNGTGATGVYAALIDTGVYTQADTDEFWDGGGANDPIDAIIGTAIEITTKTYTDGLFDGADIVVPLVSGTTAEAIVIYVANAGAATTWRLFAYMDTGVTGLPVTPNGTNININWSG